MNRTTLTAALALAAMGLSACGDHDGRLAANPRICADFKATSTAQAGVPAIAASDAATPVDECLRRWSYSLASARDPANVVADAAIAACGTALSRWNQTAIGQPGAVSGSVQALSLTTGEPTNAWPNTAPSPAAGRCSMWSRPAPATAPRPRPPTACPPGPDGSDNRSCQDPSGAAH